MAWGNRGRGAPMSLFGQFCLFLLFACMGTVSLAAHLDWGWFAEYKTFLYAVVITLLVISALVDNLVHFLFR